MIAGVCRICRCTDSTACVLEATQLDGSTVVQPCWWLEPDLCSGCGVLEEVDETEEDDAQAEELPLLYDAFNRPVVIGGRQ